MCEHKDNVHSQQHEYICVSSNDPAVMRLEQGHALVRYRDPPAGRRNPGKSAWSDQQEEGCGGDPTPQPNGDERVRQETN
jgi:hypothetical protein